MQLCCTTSSANSWWCAPKRSLLAILDAISRWFLLAPAACQEHRLTSSCAGETSRCAAVYVSKTWLCFSGDFLALALLKGLLEIVLKYFLGFLSKSKKSKFTLFFFFLMITHFYLPRIGNKYMHPFFGGTIWRV